MKRLILALCVGAAASLCGCKTTAGVSSLSEFRGFCLTGGQHRSNACDTNAPCQSFSDAMSRDFTSLDACLTVCNEEYQRQSFGNFNCASVLAKAQRLCIQYCRTNYKE